jgi:hypothetical protein
MWIRRLNHKECSTMKYLSSYLMIVPALFLSLSFANADTPTSLRGEHGAQVTKTGKISLFRAQIQGLEIGPPNDRLDAEVLVTLDSDPDTVFGISYHKEDPAARTMIETLREAYLRAMPVTLQAPMMPGRKHLRLIWVQLGK